MATDVTMPKLSDTMTEGTFVSWKKSKGERVERGDILAEVETDKATMELEAFASGTLVETRVQPGDRVPVGTVIAVIGEEGEAAGKEEPAAVAPRAPAAERRSPAAEEREKEAAAPPSAARETPPAATAEETKGEAAIRRESGLGALGEGVTAAATPEAKEPVPQPKGEERPQEQVRQGVPEHPAEKASPLVRRLARERGIDLAQIRGSGPEGRILRKDLEHEPPRREPSPQPAAPPPQGAPSRMRAAIARKVVETWRTTPHFAVTVEIDMAQTEALRRGLREERLQISLNDFVVAACARTLLRHPRVNSRTENGEPRPSSSADIGIAVALEEGLVIPVVRGCERMTLPQIAAESRRLVERARAGRLSEEELHGGSFTVSNLGMYGVDRFFAVINSPEAAILAVGAVLDKPCIREGRVVAGRIMEVTLSADHRVLDGAVAAAFLADLKRTLENPAPLLLPPQQEG